MKRIAFPCLCLLLLAVTSCQREAAVRSALARAEAVMEENPGAARQILDSIAYPQPLPKGKGVWSPRLQEGMGEASFALYALLRTQADYKCNVRLTSDSLPLIATRYYGTKRKTQRAALAQHYLGCAYSDMGRDMDAIDAFLRASTLFPDTTNKYFANSLFYLGLLYSNHNMEDSAWVALRRYRQTAVCNSDSVNIGYADYYMGSVAMYKGMDDIADSLFYCVDLNTKNSVFMKKSTYFQWAKLYFSHKHENKKALAYIDKIGNYFGEGNGALLSIKADILAEEQQFAGAYELYKKAIRNSSDIYTLCSSYKELASLAPLVNKGDSTRFFIDQYKELLDTINTRSQKEKIAEVKDKHIVEVREQQLQARHTRFLWGMGIAFVVIVLGSVVIVLLNERDRKNEKLEYERKLNDIKLRQIDQKVNDSEKEGEEAHQAEEGFCIQDFSAQQERVELYRQQFGDSQWKKYLSEHELDIQSKKKVMPLEEMNGFNKYLHTLFADLFLDLVNGDGNKKVSHLALEYIAMKLLGFDTDHIAYCSQSNAHAIHNRRYYLKEKLTPEWYSFVMGENSK